MKRELIRIVLVVGFLYGNGLAYATDWPTYRHDSRYSGRSPDKVIGPPLTKVWEYETYFYVECCPAVKDGMLYFGAMDNKMYGCSRRSDDAVN